MSRYTESDRYEKFMDIFSSVMLCTFGLALVAGVGGMIFYLLKTVFSIC